VPLISLFFKKYDLTEKPNLEESSSAEQKSFDVNENNQPQVCKNINAKF
jgi:hypothetical protein